MRKGGGGGGGRAGDIIITPDLGNLDIIIRYRRFFNGLPLCLALPSVCLLSAGRKRGGNQRERERERERVCVCVRMFVHSFVLSNPFNFAWLGKYPIKR